MKTVRPTDMGHDSQDGKRKNPKKEGNSSATLRTSQKVSAEKDTEKDKRVLDSSKKTGKESSKGKGGQEKKKKSEAETESDAISKLVADKLDLYLNCRRFENRFDPSGRRWGIANQFVPSTCISLTDKEEKRLFKYSMKPKTKPNSEPYPYSESNLRRPRTCQCRSREAKRINDFAHQLITKYPIERIAEIHRYRPFEDENEEIRLQNLRQHFGATLNSDNYVKYYTDQGLHTGNPEVSNRLKKISKSQTKLSNSSEYSQTSPRKEKDLPRGQSSGGRSSGGRSNESATDQNKMQKSKSGGQTKPVEVNKFNTRLPHLPKRVSSWNVAACLSQSMNSSSSSSDDQESDSTTKVYKLSIDNKDNKSMTSQHASSKDGIIVSSHTADSSLSSFTLSGTCITSDDEG